MVIDLNVSYFFNTILYIHSVISSLIYDSLDDMTSVTNIKV